MSVLRKNILSNILGKGLSAVLSLIFVPYYIRLLGAEAYGLIGVFATLQSVFMVADLGLSGAFIRETARLSVLEDGAHKICDLGRTFEGAFFFLGIIIALFISGCSHLFAEHWVNVQKLSLSTVSSSIVLIGIIIGLQFPLFVYQGGLQGLQRQSIMNVLLVATGLLKGLGAVLILIFVEQSILAFFIWQAIICVLQLILARMLMWRSFPDINARPQFDLKVIRPLWRFAAGTAGITLSGIILTQVDKVLLAKMLSLEKFGYYTLAWVVAGVPGMIALPINNAVYPRLAQLVAIQNISDLTTLYHRSCQLIAVLCIPIGLVLTFFSKELMFIWTGNATTAENTYRMVSILVSGSTLMGLMVIPYSLQLAFAWTRLGLFSNVISVVILIPSLFWLVSAFGALGACFVWLALYLGQAIVMIYLMHQHILKGEKYKWYIDDVALPLLLPLIVVAISRLMIDTTTVTSILIANLSVVFFLAVFTSVLSANYTRKLVLTKIYSICRH